MSYSYTGMTAPLQPGYAYMPTAYTYPDAAFTQQPYATSPYIQQGYAPSSMQQTMQGLVAQLGVLVQALQGVIANLSAGLPGNYGMPGAYSGYQQLNGGGATGGGPSYVAPSYDPTYAQPSYPQASYPQQSFPTSLPQANPGMSGCKPGCPCCSGGTSTGQSSTPSSDLPPIPSDPAPTPRTQSPSNDLPPVPTEEPPAPAPSPDPAPAPAPAPAPGPTPTKPLGELTPNAWRDPNGLSEADKQAVCGPVAAIAFARAMGKEISIDQAADIARGTGWDQNGMKGPDHEVRLLDAMGVKAHKEDGVDWEHVKREVAAGRPVIIDTPQHYYVVEGYNPQTGEFNFGQSAAIKKSHNGKTWLKPEELSVSGGARNGIYLG